MCRNIKTLFNFDPPVTDEEVRAAALQFVRKITGFNKPRRRMKRRSWLAVDEHRRYLIPPSAWARHERAAQESGRRSGEGKGPRGRAIRIGDSDARFGYTTLMTDSSRNALARASSSYLRSAMHQPIQWREFGEEAFAAARSANKPMLLDIGAVWCHWCHVMDRESYDDAEVAAIVNEHYIAVKVDRDERPDIDSRYQAAVAALTGQGGGR